MSASEMRQAKEQGRLSETADGTGFFVLDRDAGSGTVVPDPHREAT